MRKWKLTCYYPDVWKRLPYIHAYHQHRVNIMLTYNKECTDIHYYSYAKGNLRCMKRKSFDNREDAADRCGRGIQMCMQFPFFFRSVRRGVIFKNYPKMGFWVHSSSFDHVNSIERNGGLYCVWTGQVYNSSIGDLDTLWTDKTSKEYAWMEKLVKPTKQTCSTEVHKFLAVLQLNKLFGGRW